MIMDQINDPPEDAALATIECRRCRVRVEVTGKRPLTITYDVGDWHARCHCSHLSGPVHCSSFLELERLLNAFRAH
jgi:hypothetical protein